MRPGLSHRSPPAPQDRGPHGAVSVDGALVPDRRFPPPWIVEEHNNACLVVKDATGQACVFL